MSPELRLASVENFRDFGGFRLADGRTARRGRLLRSAHLATASDEDLSALARLPLSIIVDLRRATERRAAPGRRPPGFSGAVIESDDGDLGEAPHIEFLRRGDHDAEAVEGYLQAYYREAPFLPRHRALFAAAFARLDGAPGAMLVHCTAGKDRTGLLVALIRTALGGDWAATLADFEATNRTALTEARIAAWRPKLEAMTGAAPDPAVIQAFLGVWPRHLEAAFAEITARSGSLAAYLDELGVDAARRRRLVDQLAA